MKRVYILTVLYFITTSLLYAQTYIFEGLVDTKYKIRVTLTIADKEVKGTCANAQQGTVNPIEGTVADGTIQFVEKTKSGELIGSYEGEIMANYMFKGELTREGIEEAQPLLLIKMEKESLSPLKEFLAGNTSEKTIKANSTPYKRGNINAVLMEFRRCIANDAEDRKCREYIAKTACTFYGIADFLLDKETDTYVKMSDMPSFVQQHELWRKLGNALDKGVFDKVIPHLLAGKPAIAFNTREDYTHVAVLLPGEGAKSGSWRAVVPNAASFFVWKPEQSFTERTLNYAFARPQGIEIWIRE